MKIYILWVLDDTDTDMPWAAEIIDEYTLESNGATFDSLEAEHRGEKRWAMVEIADEQAKDLFIASQMKASSMKPVDVETED